MSLTIDEKQRAMTMASGMAGDFDAQKATEFAVKHQDKGFMADFRLLFDMIMDKDFSFSVATWALIAGALAYVICPIDIIPDFIPIVGWLDDAFVLSMVVTSLDAEITAYKRFKGLEADA
jgi:uncharacterized membrane protein YkvA (DUF1232 family)